MQPRRADAGTELRFRTEAGVEVVTTLEDANALAIMAGSPVREFSWHRSQRNYPGWLWTATTETLVGYESLLERDRVLLADFDVSMTGIASQPFWLCGMDGLSVRRHAPDYLLMRSDGSVVVVDVKPAVLCSEPEVAAVLEWTGRVCAGRGWRYEVFHGGDPLVMANLRFLTMGRRSRFLEPDAVAALEGVRPAGVTLAEAESRVLPNFDPLDVRAAALSLLWRQVWLTDLTVPLSSRSVISTSSMGEAACPMAS